MTIDGALRAATQQLLDVSPSARLDSLILLSFVTGKRREALLAHSQGDLPAKQLAELNALVARRQAGEPVAYLTGVKEFYGRPFRVTPATLIPRPESEQLIDIARALALSAPRILDVGTGSGCLAISLKKELPESEVTAVDISPAALAVAQENARNLGAAVTFFQSDLLADLAKPAQGSGFQLIVANLPYLNPAWPDLAPEKGLQFEPASALFAENDGLDLIYQLINQAPDFLEIGGWLLLELDPRQEKSAISYAEARGFRLEKAQPFALLFQKIA